MCSNSSPRSQWCGPLHIQAPATEHQTDLWHMDLFLTLPKGKLKDVVKSAPSTHSAEYISILHSPQKLKKYNDEDKPVRLCSYCCVKEGQTALKVIVWGRKGA